MGMTLLETALLSDSTACYDYSKQIFKEDLLEEMIEGLSERYSIELVEVLGNMLETNPNRRASLMEVHKALDNYWSS